MTHPEALKASRQQKLVPDDKFDRHMTMARVNDIESRKAIFDRQTEDRQYRETKRKNLKSSIY
jgi:hypothetical protein